MEKKQDLEKQIKEEAKEVFAATSKDIFEKHGDVVHSFGWTQYTPYFNDGEPCEFGTGELFIVSKADHEKDDDNEEEFYYESPGEFGAYGTDDNKLVKTFYEYKQEEEPYNYQTRQREPKVIEDRLTTYKPGTNRSGIVGPINEVDNPNYDPVYGEAKDDITHLFGLLDETTLESMFGNHVVIIVTADGVSVEEYSHD